MMTSRGNRESRCCMQWSVLLIAVATTTTAAAATTITAAATATISAVAATAAPAAVTAAATTAALSLGAGFVDIDGASADLGAVERRDGFVAVLVAGHLDETKAARAACIAIGHNAHAVYLSITLEQLPQFILTGVKAQVPHKNILHASSPALSGWKCELSCRTGRTENAFLKILTGAGNSRMRHAV